MPPTSIKFRNSIERVKSRIQPDESYFTTVSHQGLQSYQDKLTPLLHHNYDIGSHSPYQKTKPPVTLSNVLEVPITAIIDLRIRPGEDYFVLWLLISSYFPLIAACLGPLANMVGIISIMEKWKVDLVSLEMVKDNYKVLIMN
ncbi:uncharacterized protein J8A68_000941 [[Candida] subhashii]|uniref:Uncharacterized protein n=1 Tax=[Candida] subhashii TaxID=561895 RepID=A0A8J5V501_9ASCO|nr:uncharacterized protein J8A68_000941 [[Candida] subhashii]KAG7665539.1 hypothetical protein J8A68_000941 [[Candida] subhashii]